jgi:uncharacterized repeat protein (TIGR01451 family)
MSTRPDQPPTRPTTLRRRVRRWARRWQWQAILALIIVLAAVDGQAAAASDAGPGAAARMAGLVRRLATPVVPTPSPAVAQPSPGAAAVLTDARPDLSVAFAQLEAAQAGQPFRYTIQVRNDGTAGGAATLSALLPPEATNVRVTAPAALHPERRHRRHARLLYP